MAVKIDKEKCIGCGACIDVCPVSALTMVNDKSTVDEAACVDIGASLSTYNIEAMEL